MRISVGSTNPLKITAVKETLKLYPKLFPQPEVIGIDITMDQFGHPNNLKATVNGAIDRAKNAYQNCNFSFGLEGGLMKVPYSKSGYMEVAVCAIYDGRSIYLGLSPAFEWPRIVTELIVKNQADASQAFFQLGLSNHKKHGAVEGGILGMLTQGRLTREEQTKQSIITALIHLERPDLYH